MASDPVRELRFDEMDVRIHGSEAALGAAAADHAARVIGNAIEAAGVANVMFASGNSQLAFLRELRARDDVDWSRVVGFHMDEYLGIDAGHPACFRRYMREHITDHVCLQAFHELRGDAPGAARSGAAGSGAAGSGADEECARYSALLDAHPLDLCFLGIGENGHLAFNDPPVADFADPLDVKVVALDEACRRQQVGEGHFAAFDDVPTHARTVTIPALLRASAVLAIVPEARKRAIVAAALTRPVSTDCPASVLRTQEHVTLYLDDASGEGIEAP